MLNCIECALVFYFTAYIYKNLYEIKVNLSVLKEITLLKSALVEMFDFYILNQYVLITFSDAPQKYTYFNVLHNILKHL